MQRRTFLTKAALAATATSTALLAACGKKESGEVGAPAVSTAKKTAIKWRLQTYAGPALAEHVIKPSIDAFNKAANVIHQTTDRLQGTRMGVSYSAVFLAT